jgi:WD40 repeat protein
MDPSKTHLSRQLKHDSPIISCRFDRSGKSIFFGDQESRIWRWEWSGDQKSEYAGNESWCRALACDPSNQVLIAGGFDGRLTWWPTTGNMPQPIRKLDAHQGWIRAVAISSDGQTLASVGNDRIVKLWNFADGKLIREMSGHESHIYNVAFHPSGQSVVTADLKCNLFHWEVASGKLLRQLKAASLHKYDDTFKADIGGCTGLNFDSTGKKLAAGGISNVTNAFAGIGEPAVVILDWESGKEMIQHESKAKVKGVVWGLAFLADNTLIGVTGGPGGGFLFHWKPDLKIEAHQFKLPNTGRDMDLAPDQMHVAVAHFDQHVRVYRMADKT